MKGSSGNRFFHTIVECDVGEERKGCIIACWVERIRRQFCVARNALQKPIVVDANVKASA